MDLCFGLDKKAMSRRHMHFNLFSHLCGTYQSAIGNKQKLVAIPVAGRKPGKRKVAVERKKWKMAVKVALPFSFRGLSSGMADSRAGLLSI
jgi:hypothetical protein